MKLKGLAFIAAIAGIGIALAGPAIADTSPFVGTWVLSAAKSKASDSAAVPKSATLVISDAGGGKFKSVSDTEMNVGTKVHGEITFAIDGKEYSPVPDPMKPAGPFAIVETFEQIDARSYKTTVKMGGTVVATILNQVSADGKTLTLTPVGTRAFASTSSVTVYDRK